VFRFRDLRLGGTHSLGPYLYMVQGVGGYQYLGACLVGYLHAFLFGVGRNHGLVIFRSPKSLGEQRVMPLLHRVYPQGYRSRLQSMRIAPRGSSQYWSTYGSGGWLLSGSWNLSLGLFVHLLNYWSRLGPNGLVESRSLGK